MTTETTKTYACEVCGKVLKSGWGLSGHKRSHEPKGEAKPVVTSGAPSTFTGLRPGTLVGEGLEKQKVPYTMQWIQEHYTSKTFIPQENIPVTWNGVMVRLIADVEMTVPSIFYDIYQEYRRNKLNHEIKRQDSDTVFLSKNGGWDGGVTVLRGGGYPVREGE